MGTLSGQEEPARRGSLRAWLVVGLLMVAFLLSMLDRTILSLLIVPIQRDFGVTDTQFGLLVGFAFSLFYSVAGIPLGWLVDRVSRTRLLAASIALWSLATALTGFGSRYLHLFLARMGVGIGEATLSPAAFSMMADMFDARQLSRAIGIFYLGSTLGLGGAFLFGGTLAHLFGGDADVAVPLLGEMRPWQVAFLLAGAPGLLLALVFLCVREPPRRAPAGAEGASWRDFWTFLRLRWQPLLLIMLAFSMLNTATYAVWGWGPASLARTHGLAPGTVGMILAVAAGVLGSVGLLLGGGIADRWTRRRGAAGPMQLGALAVALSIPFAAGYTLAPAGSWLLSAICLSLVVGLLFLTIPGALAGLQLLTPPRLRGRTSAIFTMLTSLIGASLGPLAVGLLNDRLFANPAMINLSLALLFAVALPASALLFRAAGRPVAAALEGATP